MRNVRSCPISPTRHFEDRFRGREISKLISLDGIRRRVSEAFAKGLVAENTKHEGLEGPRYRVVLLQDRARIIVVVEKTSACLRLVTVWSQKGLR